MRHAEGFLKGAEAEGVAGHVASCRECREKRTSMETLAARLNTEWLGARLRTTIPQEWGCPSTEEIGRYFLEETAFAERERLEAHLAGCRRCREVLTEMEQEAATLVQADPLGVKPGELREPWWRRLWTGLGLFPRPAWAGLTMAIALAFVAGLLLRPILMGPTPTVPDARAYRIAKPLFKPEEVPAFGIAPSVKPEADRRFLEAMASYAEPNFADKAVPKLREAVAIDPRHDQAQFWLGIVYLLRGETGSAIPPLEEAVKLAPARLDYKQYLILAYLRVGRNEDALHLQAVILQKQ